MAVPKRRKYNKKQTIFKQKLILSIINCKICNKNYLYNNNKYHKFLCFSKRDVAQSG